MNRPLRRPAGFTLIELLVVIAILGLLVAVLMPALGQARDIANFTICRANMRNTSTAFPGYASNHEGRFPGGARSSVDYWYVCWMQLLNREWYHGNDPAYYPKGAYDDEPTCGPILKFWTFWGEPYYPNALLHKKWVTCTAYRAWGAPPGNSNQWSRPWQSNDYTSGGHYDWDIPGYGGKSLLNPSSVNPAYVEYHLGRKMDDFRAPSTKFLIWDAEAYNDYSHGGTATGTVVLGLDGTVAPWCADGYELAFRHLLPRDKRMYQAMGRASIAYLDGHVGILNPNLPMYKPEFFPPD